MHPLLASDFGWEFLFDIFFIGFGANFGWIAALFCLAGRFLSIYPVYKRFWTCAACIMLVLWLIASNEAHKMSWDGIDEREQRTRHHPR